MVELKCLKCGKTRKVYPSQIGTRVKCRGGKYYCRTCWDADKKRLHASIYPPTPKAQVKCPDCGKVRELCRRDAAARKTDLCSSCYKKSPKGRTTVAVTCPGCGAARHVKPSAAKRMSGYCKVCARKGEWSSQWEGGKITIQCSVCQAPKKVKPSVATDKADLETYKCVTCWNAGRLASENPNWRGGLSFEKYPEEWNEPLRRRIRSRDEHTCAMCPAQSRTLAVHHIDYDKSNCTDGNLISLCRRCHPKTNFNRDEHMMRLSKVAAEREDKLCVV